MELIKPFQPLGYLDSQKSTPNAEIMIQVKNLSEGSRLKILM